MPVVNSAGIFVEYYILTIPHLCGIIFMCLREGRNDDHPAQERLTKMKKYHVTIRPINGTWEYPYKTWSGSIYAYSKKRAEALALEQLQKDYPISGETVKVDVEIVKHKYQMY